MILVPTRTFILLHPYQVSLLGFTQSHVSMALVLKKKVLEKKNSTENTHLYLSPPLSSLSSWVHTAVCFHGTDHHAPAPSLSSSRRRTI